MKRITLSKGKKRLLTVLGAFLALIAVMLMVVFWYYPHYESNSRHLDISVEDPGQIRMMSYNLRYLNPFDLFEKSWYCRADLIVDDILEHAPGIIGFQEATQWQYAYMVNTLLGYDSVITYRDDTLFSEGCPIFYNTEAYSLVDKGSFWLSETPEVMSKAWGAEHYRVCSYVILKDKHSGKEFVVFNTHLDHTSDEARIKGIGVVLDKIAQFGGLPAVLMGDFNAEEGSETYSKVTENFLDARYAAENTVDTYTYQNWGDLENSRRIDYFMLSKTGLTALRYSVLTEPHNGIYPSDHCAIILDVTLD